MKTARWAASGGNSQPWHIRASESDSRIDVELSVDPAYSKDPSAMDLGGHATAMSLGCLAKTLEIVALNDGWGLIESVHISDRDLYLGKVVLAFSPKVTSNPSISIEDLLLRRTDRTRYLSSDVPEDVVGRLRHIVERSPGMTMSEIPRSAAETTAKLISLLKVVEHIRWRSPLLMAALVDEVSFTDPPESTKIPVTQLGVSRADQAFLAFFRRFKWARGFFKLGADALPVRRAVNDFVNYSDRICFLQVSSTDTSSEFSQSVHMGELFQELWIEANRMGLAFQPLGLPFIVLGGHRYPDELHLTSSQQVALRRVAEEFKREFEIDLKKIVIGFRIGYPTAVAEKAPRRDFKVHPLLAD